MNLTDQTLSQSRPKAPRRSFCTYLAKQFIAKKRFKIGSVPEAKGLAAPGNILLTYSDGYTFTILCMIDREISPGAAFALDVDKVRQIGEACLRYTGKVNRSKMPVFIRIVEVGPGSPDQQKRLENLKRSSRTSKVIPSAMIVDTASGEVWSSDRTWLTKGTNQRFVKKLLTTPREADADLRPPIVRTANPSFPVLTTVILGVLATVFAAELVYGIGPWTKMLQPTIPTLVAFGGIAQSLVLRSGEWYRLLSAPFLHADAVHLLMNAIGLFVAGHMLESLIGRAWFGTVYVAGALGGSLLSLALNPAAIISVGASGAIMGLFAAMMVVSLHFPPGVLRTALRMNAFYVLIPSLLPLTGALHGQHVDYAAHFGGVIGGGFVGLIMLGLWRRTDPLPRFRQAAAAIAIVSVVALTYPAISVARNYQAAAFTTQLIPSDKLPRTSAEMLAHARELITQYPHDPRPRFLRAANLLDAGDLAGAEREARAGLAEEDIWRPVLSPQIGNGLRVVLAIAISGNRRSEALSIAEPACAAIKDGSMRKLLDDRKLCGR